ncbi:AI-2E family transporter [Hydrocarboniclastica marina]|uniref:AI-2E family transporter n=1 Tax=Hydrocarboniclastica marina TaxID=2259620 RepID=A0A4P7XIA7_9ALTE|nr:AI-2E family transporter [Hydrocarboniclastica marina]QCF26811.1 AI-2E family transporter [Hydrocarboniclastica marina]
MPEHNQGTWANNYSRRVWLAVAAGSVAVTLLVLLWNGFGVLLTIFAAVLLGLALLAPAHWLSQHSFLSQRWALTAVLLAIIGSFTLLGNVFASNLADQFQQMVDALPASVGELEARIRKWPLGDHIVEEFNLRQLGSDLLGKGMSQMSFVLSTTLGAAFTVFFIIAVALFFAFEPGTYRRGFLRLLPPARRDRTEQLLFLLRHKLNWWMLGRLASMTVVGLATSLGLWLLGMPMYLSLGALAAILVFIPNLGPLISAIPALLIALSEGLAGQVALLYIGVQTVESNLITPLIDRKSVKLPPALLFSAQISLGLVAGTLGLVLAAPLTVLAMVLTHQVWVEGWLEKGNSASVD